MVTGVIVRIITAGGLAGNPPGALGACVALHPLQDSSRRPATLDELPELGVLVFENGELLLMSWPDFHAGTVVVGHAGDLCGIYTAAAIHRLSPDDRRALFAPFFRADWPASPRQLILTAGHLPAGL
jgi:hypothetical protein